MSNYQVSILRFCLSYTVANMNTGLQYSLLLTITFIPYIIVELPSNLWLQRVGPNVLLPIMVSLWGIAAAMQGVSTNYRGIVACRFFLGLCEGTTSMYANITSL